jgi:hypothetical protein
MNECLSADIIDWVSVSLHIHRLDMLDQLADASLRNRALSFTLAQALGHRKNDSDPPELEWQLEEREIECMVRVQVETAHPFNKDDLCERNISLPPNTSTVTIRFNHLTKITSWQTVEIRVKGKTVWSGSSTDKNELPGIGECSALVINPTGGMSVRFTDLPCADESKRMTHWGYGFTVEAPLAQSLIDKLMQSKAGSGWPAWACAEALSNSNGNVSSAGDYLKEHSQRLQAEDKYRKSRASRLGLFKSKCLPSKSSQQWSWLEGAIFDAQGGSVFFRRRGGFEPLPEDLLEISDFQDLKEVLQFTKLGQPNCVIKGQNVYREKHLQFTALGAAFTAELWEQIPSSGSVGHLQEERDGGWSASKNVNHPAAANLPYRKDAVVRYLGSDWQQLGHWRKELPQRLAKSSALKALLDKPVTIKGEISNPPQSWLEAFGWPCDLKDTQCFVSKDRQRQALLCPGERSWAELRVLPTGHVVIYVLEEVARAVHRRAVWSSDARATLLCRDPDASGRLRTYPSALESAGGDLWEVSRSYSRPSLRVMRDTDVHIPRRLLEGLLPRVLLRDKPVSFDFWHTASGIRGEPRDVRSPWFNYTLHIDLPNRKSDEGAVRRTGSGGEVWFLINIEAAAAQDLWGLCDVLKALEPLAYVLIWAARLNGSGGHPASGEQLELRLIEMPRLGLRFEPEHAKDGSCRLYSRAHAGFFSEPQPVAAQELPTCIATRECSVEIALGRGKACGSSESCASYLNIC